MAYKIETTVIVQSAVVELTGEQINKLAGARDAFAALADGTTDPGLLAVRSLLNEIAAVVLGKAAPPAPRGKAPAAPKRQMTAAQRAHLAEAQRKAREVLAARKARRDAMEDLDELDDLDEDEDSDDGDL